MNRMTELYCPNCQTSKSFSNFHNHILVGKKFLPYCKSCCSKKLREYIVKTKDEGAGLWCLLAELGIPFLKEVWEPTKKIVLASTNAGRKPDLFLTYVKTVKELGLVLEGFWQSDMMLDDFIDISNDEESEEVKIDWEEQIRVWGKFVNSDGELDEESYNYLNFTFEDYTKDLIEMDANLIRRYRDLCKAELRKRKADESGDIQEIAKAQDNLKKMLDMLKLSDFKDNKQSDIEKFIERMSWNIENTKPAECEDTQKYKDFSNFGINWEDIMRTVKNLVVGTREYPEVSRDER